MIYLKLRGIDFYQDLPIDCRSSYMVEIKCVYIYDTGIVPKVNTWDVHCWNCKCILKT